MKVSEIKYENLTNDVIDKILFEGILDDGIDGDCILVFGSRKAIQYRVPKSVEIYKNNRAKKILMSGGKEVEIGERRTLEAIAMQDKALELGVSKEDIIVETFSVKSTKENILGSLIQLDRTLGLNKINRLLLVTTCYHMRRCIIMAKTYMPDWIEFSMCAAKDTNTLRHNWFLTEQGIQRARNEAYKIICYIREGSIPDFPV